MLPSQLGVLKVFLQEVPVRTPEQETLFKELTQLDDDKEFEALVQRRKHDALRNTGPAGLCPCCGKR